MAKQRAFANQEREYQARRFGKFGRAAVMTLATLLSFFAISLLVADQMYRPESFKISQLKIIGQFRYIEPSEIEGAVGDEPPGNFFSIDLGSIKSRVEGLAWVSSVDVRREWPGTLVLSVQEHRPVMRWGDDKWVTTTGKVIKLPTSIAIENVISVNGRESQARRILMQAGRWKKQMSAHGLELTHIRLSDSDAWTLTLNDLIQESSFELLLGYQDVNERLARFEHLFNQKIRFSENPLKRVDARYPDGLAIAHAKAASEETTYNSNAMEYDLAIAINQ